MSEVDKYKYFQNYYLIIDNAPIYERSTIQEATNVYAYPPHTHQSQILSCNLGRLQKVNLNLQRFSMVKVFKASRTTNNTIKLQI